jgi:undecaprenyl-diphosphatase
MSISLALQSIVLGIVQGLTEFLPVSSSAHLVILPWLFGWDNPAITGLSFDVALHLGTLVAVLAFFFRDWARLIASWFKSVAQRKIGDDADRRMAWFIVLACIPGGIAGVLFEGAVQSAYHVAPIARGPMLAMAAAIALMGGLLWLADALAVHGRPLNSMRPRDAGLVGLAQALAIFPGVSRSGATITAGLALGLTREAAAKFSFLLSAPIIAGAGLKSALDLVKGARAGTIGGGELALFPVGFVAAALAGFFCIKALMAFLREHSMKVFAWYRWGLAVLVAAVALAR